MIQAKEINIQQTSETICKSDILCKLYNYRFWGKGRYALKNKKNNAVLFYVKLTIYLKDLKLTALTVSFPFVTYSDKVLFLFKTNVIDPGIKARINFSDLASTSAILFGNGDGSVFHIII